MVRGGRDLGRVLGVQGLDQDRDARGRSLFKKEKMAGLGGLRIARAAGAKKGSI